MSEFFASIESEPFTEQLNKIQNNLKSLYGGELLDFLEYLIRQDVDIYSKFMFEVFMMLFDENDKLNLKKCDQISEYSAPDDLIDELTNTKSRTIFHTIIKQCDEISIAETLIYMLGRSDVPKSIKLDCGKALRSLLERENGLAAILRFVHDEKLFFNNLLIRKDEKFFVNITNQLGKIENINVALVIERLMELNAQLVQKYLWNPNIQLFNSNSFSKQEMDQNLKKLHFFFGGMHKIPFNLMNLFKLDCYIGDSISRTFLSRNLASFEFTLESFAYSIDKEIISRCPINNNDIEYQHLIKILAESKNEVIMKRFLPLFENLRIKEVQAFFEDNTTDPLIKSLAVIKTDIYDPEIPNQAFGVASLVKFMEQYEYHFDENLEILAEKIKTEDEWLFIKCAKGITSLGLKYKNRVIPKLIDVFVVSKSKAKLAEVYIDMMVALGDHFDKFGSQIFDLLVGSIDVEADKMMKASLLSVLVNAFQKLQYNVRPWISKIVKICCKGLLDDKEDVLVRRGALYVISGVLNHNLFDKKQLVLIISLLKNIQQDPDTMIRQSITNMLKLLQ